MRVQIRQASPEDAALLTDLALRSKAYWGYGTELIELWRGELTITADLIGGQPTFVAHDGNRVLGFYSLGLASESAELDHLWVEPGALRKGVGSALLVHALAEARSTGAHEVRVVSDPNAEGFYVRFGAIRVGEFESVPPGRVLPILAFDLSQVESL